MECPKISLEESSIGYWRPETEECCGRGLRQEDPVDPGMDDIWLYLYLPIGYRYLHIVKQCMSHLPPATVCWYPLGFLLDVALCVPSLTQHISCIFSATGRDGLGSV